MYDERRVQDTVLALLHLNAFKDSYGWHAGRPSHGTRPTVSMNAASARVPERNPSDHRTSPADQHAAASSALPSRHRARSRTPATRTKSVP